MAGWVV